MEAIAKLNNCPTSPRKMRMVADMIRGQKVSRALSILKYESRASAAKLEKLLLSAIANWEQKNPDKRIEDANLCVKTIFVNEGKMLKRLRPAPQGRAHRIRKRSNHVTIIVDEMIDTDAAAANATAQQQETQQTNA